MAGIKSSPATTFKLFFILFLVLTVSSPSPIFVNGFSFLLYFSQYKTLISISRSLLLRVANLRDSRGDTLGSSRVRAMAEKIDLGLGLGFLSRAWSFGWGYVWRKEGLDYREMHGTIGDLNELMGLVSEFIQAGSNSDKETNIARSYEKASQVFKRLLRRLQRTFDKSGAVREFWEIVQAEVVDGALLQDCLEVSKNDVKSLLQLFSSLSGSSDEL